MKQWHDTWEVLQKEKEKKNAQKPSFCKRDSSLYKQIEIRREILCIRHTTQAFAYQCTGE